MKRIILIILMMMVFITSGLSQEKIDSTVHSSTIEFVINTDEFVYNTDYQLFINSTIPFIQEHSLEIKNILLVGSASPEGNYRSNIKLANRRADKIYSYISQWVPRDKIIVNNDYDLFLFKTGLDEKDYTRLRATYIEVEIEKTTADPPITNRDTIIIAAPIQIDTIYQRDTVYLPPKDKSKIVFGVYNSLSGDLLKRPNVGVEFYFHQMSWFVEGSFSRGSLFHKKYDIDFWHTGLRKYFNDQYKGPYIEAYGRVGWFDTELFSKDDNGVFGIFFGGGVGVGYKFKICEHWTITPTIRLGVDLFKFKNYYDTESDIGINISFGEYVNGKTEKIDQSAGDRVETIYLNTKINKDFFNNSYNLYWFGPTYIGVTIQRNFYIHENRRKLTL